MRHLLVLCILVRTTAVADRGQRSYCVDGVLQQPGEEEGPGKFKGAVDPWLELLCSKASSPTFEDPELWAQYTKVYRQLRSGLHIFREDMPKGALILSIKARADGTATSSRYAVMAYRREWYHESTPPKSFEAGLAVLKDVAEAMDAPRTLLQTWYA